MNKRLRLPSSIELKDYSGQKVLEIRVGRDSLWNWALGLLLVREGLVDTLTVTSERGNGAVEIRLDPTHRRTPAVLASLAEPFSRLEFSGVALDYLLHALLKYYRDGQAEVDHIDLQTALSDSDNEDAYVTFAFADSATPISAEEAKRRLGID